MSLDERVAELCRGAIEARTFPGCVVGYIRGGRTAVLPFGRLTYDAGDPVVTERTVYDLASITKSLPTSSVILMLVEDGRISLDQRVADFIPELNNEYREQILVRHLLTFTGSFDIGGRLAEAARENPSRLLDLVFTAPPPAPPGARYLYTNAPSLLLGVIAERVCGQSLERIAHDRLFGPLGMERTTFRPAFPEAEIAPTEAGPQGEVRGKVHDPAARALITHGQIPGHAGLFSTAGDLLRFAQMLLDGGELGGRRYFGREMIAAMHTNQIPGLTPPVGLGWVVGRPEMMGSQASVETFGKTGFTGTMMLMDPSKNMALVALSNRTYPKPSEKQANQLFMSSLADIVFAA